MYGHKLLWVNSDAFYQSLPHALDLSDDCGLIKDHIQYPLFIFLCLCAILNNVFSEV